MNNFIFKKEFDNIRGENIYLKIINKNTGNKNELPYYYYDIYLKDINVKIGKISIRIGNNYHSYYNGNVGYEINEEYRGNNYAIEAVSLVIQVARSHGMNYLNLTCEESNIASYKSIEKLGATLIEIIIPPKDYIFYYEGIKPHKIYHLDI